MFDGTCYKLIGGAYHRCKLDGTEDYFVNLYLGQPHEVDANTLSLKKLYEFWAPGKPIPNEVYYSIFKQIDEKLKVES